MTKLRFKYWTKDTPLPNTPVPYSIYVVQDGNTFNIYPVDKNGNYLELPEGSPGVQTITGDGVDNTDISNPVISYPNADDIDDTSTVNKFVDSTLIGLINNALQSGDNNSELVNDSGYITDYTVTEGDVTQYESSLSISESQIFDLNHFTPTNLFVDYGFTDNSSNWNTAFSWGDHSLQGYINSIPNTYIQNGDNISRLFNDVGYLTSFTEQNDLSSNVTWINVPDVNITESSVTQHESALTITESQISDLDHFSGSYNDLSDKPSSIIEKNTTSITNNYTCLSTDRFINVDASSGDIIVTLPVLSNIDSVGLTIKKIDISANIVTIATPNTETIDGENEQYITTSFQSRTIYTDNFNYFIQ